MKTYKILAINPGSTSTKIALYENEKEVFTRKITHSNDELAHFDSITGQYGMRYQAIMKLLAHAKVDIYELAAIVGRGGILPPVKTGAYHVNKKMVERLKNRPVVEHASNLAAMIAYEMATELSIPAFIYDSIASDELDDIARISGIKGIRRKSFCHVLNMRATAMLVANKMGRSYEDMNFIVAHLGGGISLSVHKKGKLVDIIADDEGPFSPERAGRVPCLDLIKLCYQHDKKTMKAKLRGKGGLISYLNTNDAQQVEALIEQGDAYALKIYQAMAYQIAKGIGELATVLCGEVDRIILTGGVAYSQMLTQWIQERVEFIAPVEIIPGENELESLSLGALRVLKGEEIVHEYDLD